MNRRSFFGLFVTGGAVLAAGMVGIPALLTGLSPALQGRRHPVWRPVGRLEDFAVGAVYQGLIPADRQGWPRSLGRQAVFVWRRSEAEMVVFSRSCTDLGCPLDYDAGSACFFCPCHGGIFAQDGQRLAGPPNRPMHRYVHRLRDGVIEIDVTSLPPGA
jgi:menaquinol-cytochrome c reductase iron-sulfur subunit